MTAAGTYPALKLEFAPGVAASAAPGAGDWVDISDRLRSFSIKWGREDDLSQPSAGTMALRLDNSDGNLDPDNTAGTWYPDLLPLVWVRLKGGTTTANTDMFYGQVSIDGWRLVASQHAGSVDVAVTVLDGLEQLANTRLRSVYEMEVRADSPTAWYRLGESSGTVAVDSSGNNLHGTYEGGATFNSRGGLIAGDSDAAIEFAANQRASIPAAAVPADYPFSLEMTFQLPTIEDTTSARYLCRFAANNGVGTTTDDERIFVDVPTVTSGGAELGKPRFAVATSSTDAHVIKSTAAEVDDDRVHHLIVTAASAASLKMWLDGVDVGTDQVDVGTVATPPFSTAPTTGVGNRNDGDLDGAFLGIVDEFVIFDSVLSDARIQAHYEAAVAPWEGDLTGTRVGDVLDAVNWPITLRNVDAGKTTMPAATVEDASAFDLLAATADADGGLLYVDHHDGGKLRFEDRHQRLTATRSTTSQATFGDGGGSEVPYAAVDVGDDTIVNTVTASRFGGSDVTVADSASQALYQERDYSLTGLLTTSDSEVEGRASAMVAEKKDRKRRVRSLVLEPRADAHPAWGQVFARRPADRVTVKWRPPYGGTYSYVCWIEGVAHEWDQPAAAWRTTLWLSPVPFSGAGTTYWIWDTSTWETDSRWGV